MSEHCSISTVLPFRHRLRVCLSDMMDVPTLFKCRTLSQSKNSAGPRSRTKQKVRRSNINPRRKLWDELASSQCHLRSARRHVHSQEGACQDQLKVVLYGAEARFE